MRNTTKMMVFSGNTRILLLPLLSLFLFLSLLMNKAQSFNMPGELSLPSSRFVMRYPNTQLEGGPTSKGGDTKNDNSMNEVIARRLIVSGNVNGGYIRTCIMNEVRNPLSSPPSSSTWIYWSGDHHFLYSSITYYFVCFFHFFPSHL